MTTTNHIIFVGFMGSGKSTVARCLADKLGMASLDVDACIQLASGKSVVQIFEEEGEAGFRRRETAFLASMFDRERAILSCGGGVVLAKENRQLLRQLGWVIYLKVSADVALARIGDTTSRPLLANKNAAQALLTRRETWYEEVADEVVDTNKLSVQGVVERVTKSLESHTLLP
jgi:shikimate kinase